MTFTNIDGQEYALSDKLRVAYKIQGMNNHRAYSDVFASIGDMTLEKQIEILFCAFDCSNPGIMKQAEFQNYYLDNFNLGEMMDQLKGVVEGIMGKDLVESASGGDESLVATPAGNAGSTAMQVDGGSDAMGKLSPLHGSTCSE